MNYEISRCSRSFLVERTANWVPWPLNEDCRILRINRWLAGRSAPVRKTLRRPLPSRSQYSTESDMPLFTSYSLQDNNKKCFTLNQKTGKTDLWRIIVVMGQFFLVVNDGIFVIFNVHVGLTQTDINWDDVIRRPFQFNCFLFTVKIFWKRWKIKKFKHMKFWAQT